jgi:hypothetical protein
MRVVLLLLLASPQRPAPEEASALTITLRAVPTKSTVVRTDTSAT